MSGPIEFVDQTRRDGPQSLWGIRMCAYQEAQALPQMDRIAESGRCTAVRVTTPQFSLALARASAPSSTIVLL